MIKDIYCTFRKIIRENANIRRQIKSQTCYQVQFYNCWEQENDQMYWNRFIRARKLLDLNPNVTVAVISVFGPRRVIPAINADVKVFLTGETLKCSNYYQFSDSALGEKSINLSLGFEDFEDSRYVRFPIWMDYMFLPEYNEFDIRKKCELLRFPNLDKKNKFCSMVASHGGDGIRKDMYDFLSTIENVNSAGRYLHNDDALLNTFNDDKQSYLEQFYFNICPENSSAYGYTTEKIFEAISSGCIPIYWGGGSPDERIINKDAIIYWDKETGGENACKFVRELYDNPKLLREFAGQPRLNDSAEEYIIDTYNKIESKLRDAILSLV